MNLITLVNSRRWQKDYLGIDLPTTPFYQILNKSDSLLLSNIELFEIDYQILNKSDSLLLSNIELFEIDYQILNKSEVKIET